MPTLKGTYNSAETFSGKLASEAPINSDLSTQSPLIGTVSTSGELSGDVTSKDLLDADIMDERDIEMVMTPKASLNADITLPDARSGGSGTNDYEELINKPKINSITLIKNKSFEDLGLNSMTNMELETLLQ